MKKYLFVTKILLIAFVLMSFLGCSKSENSVSRQYVLDEWEVTISLSWDKETVVGQVKPQYTGKTNLDYVVIKPNFTVPGWPEGYSPPSSGTYTWNSEKPEGAMPDRMETSTRSNSIHSKEPPRMMTREEASKILDKVTVDIEWKENQGDLMSAKVN